MKKRTAKGAVTFGLGASGEQLPAGRRPIQTDEEYVKGLSFLDYRRMATTRFEAKPLPVGDTRVAIAPRQFEAALPEDAVQAPMLDVDPPKAES